MESQGTFLRVGLPPAVGEAAVAPAAAFGAVEPTVDILHHPALDDLGRGLAHRLPATGALNPSRRPASPSPSRRPPVDSRSSQSAVASGCSCQWWSVAPQGDRTWKFCWNLGTSGVGQSSNITAKTPRHRSFCPIWRRIGPRRAPRVFKCDCPGPPSPEEYPFPPTGT